jgi:hypothetical protein
MTEGNIFYDEFMSVLQKKISHKATLVNTITELLDIDKDAVYRRLRGKVDFSFTEMATIARSLGISLDRIAGIENDQSRPAQVNISRQVNPTEVDYEMFEGHVHMLKSIKDEPDTKILEAANILPHYLYQDYEYLTRYYMFRWNQASNFVNALPYHEITIPDRLRVLQKETCVYARHISSTLYVLNYLVFQHLVTNIQYFAKIRLINEEEVSLIKNDLMMFLDNIENVAVKGKHEETGNEVSIFISDIATDADYSCLKTKNIHLTLLRAFILNATVTFDIKVFDAATAWIRSLQRMSTLISGSGEKFRAMFFEEQRKIVQTI